jgi:hypothetical protein
MATLYYISDGTLNRELSASGCFDLVLHRKAGTVSTLSWAQAADFAAAPLWPYGTAIVLTSVTDGAAAVTLFQGTVTSAQGDGTATSETVYYLAEDCWREFDRNVYEQTRAIVDAEGEETTISTSRVLLFMDGSGNRLTAGQMVSAICSYAAALGVDVQPGTFDAPIVPPYDEVREKTLSELILRALKWQPDAVPWIDHSTTPPTLNVTRRASMSALTLALTSLDACRLRSREDLSLPGVLIRFEHSNAYGRTVSQQTAGSPSSLGAARMTIPLEFEAGALGPVQEVKTVAIGDFTTAAWWRVMFPWIPMDAVISDASASPAIPEGYRILTCGTITEWMQSELELEAGLYTISCKLQCTADGHTYEEKTLTRTFTLTNAESRRYIGRPVIPWTEVAPANLATTFYAAVSAVQHSGTVSLTEAECAAARAGLGKKLLITGGLAAWASMVAAICEVEEHFDSGSTRLTVGPMAHLYPQDLIELIRATRIRTTWSPLSPLDSGAPEQDATEIDPFAPEASADAAPGKLSALSIIDPET